MSAPLSLTEWLLTALVLLGAAPLFASTYQFLLIGLHRRHAHLRGVRAVYPRTAIVVPAWNEGLVIGNTVDRLMALEYPPGALRIYVVDDASTDETPAVLHAKEREYPGRVFHVRRDQGGQGKAHTLNHGLRHILAEDWCEAVLIIDADVLFEPDALRKMARHLSDDRIGSVTAYIKEGSAPGNYLTRFVAFEYITAQAAARRAQNVFGAMACLAGGAQLHSRASLVDIGGQIDTSTLAEDTVTTFKTQMCGRRALFDGNATVWAEEPGDPVGLWKQRLRWARGNLQLTRMLSDVWLNRARYGRLGTFTFAFLWFTLLLMPVLMIGAAVGLVTLYFVDFPLSWALFRLLWIANALTYLFVTLFSFSIDPATARRAWMQGFLFPGIVSLFVIACAFYPPLLAPLLIPSTTATGLPPQSFTARGVILFLYAWLALCMAVAYAGKVLAQRRQFGSAAMVIYLAGYGPFLCAVSLASYVLEIRGKDLKWDKTVKTGRVSMAT